MNKKHQKTKYTSIKPNQRLPNWITPTIGKASELEHVQSLIKKLKLNTICEEGRCPNRGECYASGTATFLLGGSVIMESIFALNGVGFLAFESIQRQDFPVVQSIVVMLSFIYILLTFLSDVINAQLDPRIRLG